MAMRVKNDSAYQNVTWEQDGLTFHELIRQEYGGNNCTFSAGTVSGHEHDTVYLKWVKDGDEGGMLLLRPDELATIAWCASGALFSLLLEEDVHA